MDNGTDALVLFLMGWEIGKGDAAITPKVMEDFYSSWAQYTIVCRNKIERENDIPSMIYYAKGMHEQEAFGGQGIIEVSDYDGSMYLSDRALSLPMSPYLEKDEVDEIIIITRTKDREVCK